MAAEPSTETSQQTTDDPSELRSLVDAVAATPSFQTTDFILPADADHFRSDQPGVVLATVESIELGQPYPVDLGVEEEVGLSPGDIVDVPLVFNVRIDDAKGLELAAGSRTNVYLPIWTGPRSYGEQTRSELGDLTRSSGTPFKLLATVSLTPSGLRTPGFGTIVLATPAGHWPTILGSQLGEEVWGQQDVAAAFRLF